MNGPIDINKLPMKQRWEHVRLMHLIRKMMNSHGSAIRRKGKKLERQNRKRGRNAQ